MLWKDETHLYLSMTYHMRGVSLCRPPFSFDWSLLSLDSNCVHSCHGWATTWRQSFQLSTFKYPKAFRGGHAPAIKYFPMHQHLPLLCFGSYSPFYNLFKALSFFSSTQSMFIGRKFRIDPCQNACALRYHHLLMWDVSGCNGISHHTRIPQLLLATRHVLWRINHDPDRISFMRNVTVHFHHRISAPPNSLRMSYHMLRLSTEASVMHYQTIMDHGEYNLYGCFSFQRKLFVMFTLGKLQLSM